jgi:hypothetical protein
LWPILVQILATVFKDQINVAFHHLKAIQLGKQESYGSNRLSKSASLWRLENIPTLKGDKLFRETKAIFFCEPNNL